MKISLNKATLLVKVERSAAFDYDDGSYYENNFINIDSLESTLNVLEKLMDNRRSFHMAPKVFQEHIVPTAALRKLSLQQKHQEQQNVQQQNRVVNKLLALIRSKNVQDSSTQLNVGRFRNRQQQQQQQTQSGGQRSSSIFPAIVTSTSTTTARAITTTTVTTRAITTTSVPTTKTIARLLSTAPLQQKAVEKPIRFENRRGENRLKKNETEETFFSRRARGGQKKSEVYSRFGRRTTTTTTKTTPTTSTTAATTLSLDSTTTTKTSKGNI